MSAARAERVTVSAYITDGHEAANLDIAEGLFVLAYVLWVGVFVRDSGPPLSWRRRVTLGLAGLFALGAVGMTVAWATRSNAIFSGDTPPSSVTDMSGGGGIFGTGSTGSSGGSSNTGSTSGFCSTHTCIGDFNNEPGYIVECGDGTYSHAGGLHGACSHHQGEASGPITLDSNGAQCGAVAVSVACDTICVDRS